MADLDLGTGDLTLTTSRDFCRTSPVVVERVKVRLGTVRGSCAWDPLFGSRLTELRNRKLTDSTLLEAAAMVREALKPLVDAKDISALTVAVTRADTNRMEITVGYTAIGAGPVSFTTWVVV